MNNIIITKDIDIRAPRDMREYEISKELWRICFPEDTQSFVDYYYSQRTKKENVLAAFSNDGKIIGMMHILPYNANFFSKSKMGCLLAGVATHPAYRGKGVCRALFERAFILMLDRGYCFSMLQPFNTDFYRQFGYSVFSQRYRCDMRCEKRMNNSKPQNALTAQKMLAIYMKFAQQYNGMMARTLKDCQSYLNEIKTYGGEAVSDGETYALFVRENRGATVIELAGAAPLLLMRRICESLEEVRFDLPIDAALSEEDNARIIDFNMIKIIDEQAFCQDLPCGSNEIIQGARRLNYSLESY